MKTIKTAGWAFPILACLALGMAVLAASPPPQTLNYQGVLRDSAGKPYAEEVFDMEFRFYPKTGGPGYMTLLFTNQHFESLEGSVYVANGLFTVTLGTGTLIPGTCSSLGQVFRDYPQACMEVWVGPTGGPLEQLLPRISFRSSAWALNADSLDGLDSADFAAEDHWHAGLSQGTGIVPFTYDGTASRTVVLADTTVTPGSYGASSSVGTFTVDAQGRLTAASGVAIDHGSIAGLGDDDHTQYFNLSQNEAVTGQPAFNFGGAPFTVANTTVVTNLNADRLDGLHSSDFAGSSHSHATLTAGNGLGGSTYNGSSPATFAVTYGTLINTAVQGNQTANITAGSGLAGGVSTDYLGDGFFATMALGPLTANWNQTGAFDIVLNNPSSELVIRDSDNSHSATLDVGNLDGNHTYTLQGLSGTVWTSGNDGPTSTLDADTLDGLHASSFVAGPEVWVDTAGDTMTGELTINRGSGPAITASTNSTGEVIRATNQGSGPTIGALNVHSSVSANTAALFGWASGNGGSTVWNTGAYGYATGSSGFKYGLYGLASGDTGEKRGVFGETSGAATNYGGYFKATSAAQNNTGVYGEASGASIFNWAGYFNGNVHVTGSLTLGTENWVNTAGDTMTGKLTTAASATGGAGVTLPHGAAPSSPVNGDIWTTTGGVYARVSGATVGPFTSTGFDHGLLTGLTDDDHTQYFNLSQSETVTGRPAFNGGASGIDSPFTVDSTTVVTNLNADRLDGLHSSDFMGSTTDNWIDDDGDILTGTLILSTSGVNGISANLNSSATVIDVANQGAGVPIVAATHRAGSGTFDAISISGMADGSGPASSNIGVSGVAQNSPAENWGVSGKALGSAGTMIGVRGEADGPSVYNWSIGGYFIAADIGTGTNAGIKAVAQNAALNYAGYFEGKVNVVGETVADNTAGWGTQLGISAMGPAAGGYFLDSDSTSYAYAGAANYGLAGYGVTSGGYFKCNDTGGLAEGWVGRRIGSGPYTYYGVRAAGDTAGGYFLDSDDGSYGYVGSGSYGIEAQGSTAGAFFKDLDSSGYSYVAIGDTGINSVGDYAGGLFVLSNAGTNVAYAWAGHKFDNTGTPEYWGIRAYGSTGGGYFKDNDTSSYAFLGSNTAKIGGSGTLNFVQNHPYDGGKVVVYAAPEGDEVATYTRGSAKLVNGVARVRLGETFQWVTNPDIGLTAHLTPRGDCNGLYAESLSTSELVVKELAGGKSDTSFDYVVYGLRIGFEEVSIIQEKKEESYIPAMVHHRELFARQPALRAFNALERFKGMRAEMGVTEPLNLSGTLALKEAIHEFDPAVDRVADEREPSLSGSGQPPRTVAPTPPAPPSHGIERASVEPDEPAYRDHAPMTQVFTSRAERFPICEPVQEGDVLTNAPEHPGAFCLTKVMHDPGVVGVVLTEAGGAAPAKTRSEAATYDTAPVATSGVVLCKADATLTPIAPNDLLVTSSIPGHAAKAQPKIIEGVPIYTSGTVIGKALEPLESGTGLIKVLVMLR
jgi:hypothetical protein